MTQRRKRIAVLMGQADEEFQAGYLNGLTDETRAHNMDVCVFTMRTEYQNTSEREQGDASIFHAVNYEKFDAVLVMADTIQTGGLIDKIEERLHDEYHGPVLFVDGDSAAYPVIWTDCYRPMKLLINYLVKECGYTDFAFLGGKKWNRHAQTRLRAYRDALSEHGIEVRDDRIYDGDFWYSSGVSCVRQMLAAEEELPEVIVCANDVMAIGLCEELEKNGISIPDDIAVAGFDSQFEGRTAPKGVTSVRLDSVGCGKHSFAQLMALMEGGKAADHVDEAPKLFYGATCEAEEGNYPDDFGNRRWSWATYDSRMSYSSSHSTYDDDFLMPTTLEEFLQTVWGHLMRLTDIEEFQLVLDNKMFAPDGGMLGRLTLADQSQHAIGALHYTAGDPSGNGIEPEKLFPISEILPNFEEPAAAPGVRFFMPLYYESSSFGYAEAKFRHGSTGCDKEYRLYISALSRGLEILLRTQAAFARNAVTGDISAPMRFRPTGFEKSHARLEKQKKELTREEKKEYKETIKILDHNLFRYFFQPIVSAEDGEIYSYEALMRVDSALPISPLDVIRYAQMEGRLYDIERDTLINVLNIISTEEVFRDKKVFINSIPGVLLDEEDLAKVERLIKKCGENVVIEITEQGEMGDSEIEEMKEKYRGLGTRIAIDDYGTGYSNAGNLLRYMPDIVKIDRSLLSDLDKNPQKQHFVREIIDFCHDNGMMALAEGVETSEELRAVIRFGVDLIQGYYTGRPSADPVDAIPGHVRSEIVRYQKERTDGSDQSVYVAGKAGRVLMGTLIKEGITHVVVGDDKMTYRDIAFAGAPGQKSNIHIMVSRGYEGIITLENITLSNIKDMPCIDISEGCHVIISLVGNSVLYGNGIRVADGSTLRLEGGGNLEIRVNNDAYYGIGGSPVERHGQITCSQDGEIKVDANGRDGVCIGSGKGGGIEINRGRYVFIQSGQNGVAVGSFEGYEHFVLQDSAVSVDSTMTDCVCFGSLRGSSDVRVERASLRINGAAKRMSAIGTISGANADFSVTDANIEVEMQVDAGTCIGSMAGASAIRVCRGSVKLDNSGKNALLLGGFNENSRMNFEMANVRGSVYTEERKWSAAPRENIRIDESRLRFDVNGAEEVV